MNLQGKTALVTGSTSGIGLGIAQTLANAGAQVILNGFGDVDAAINAVSEWVKNAWLLMRQTSAMNRKLST